MAGFSLNINNFLNSEYANLTERQQEVLRSIVRLYILKAAPVGSRNLSKYLKDTVNVSPATIRNAMADLEEMDFISHPHTSAGRVPTDKGYRFYVDTLRSISNLPDNEFEKVKAKMSKSRSDLILKEASKVLGSLSRYLGIVQIPHLLNLIVHKIELVQVSSSRLLVVLVLDSNIVRTATIEAEFEFENKYLLDINTYINEKIAGKQLQFLKENFAELIEDFAMKDIPLVRLFVDSIDKIFNYQGTRDKLLTAGTQNLLEYPEFEDLNRVRGVIELIENEDIIIHLLEKYEDIGNDVKVLIGQEMENELLGDYSIVLTKYNIGSATGSIGLIGPKRMDYPKMISVVANVSKILSE